MQQDVSFQESSSQTGVPMVLRSENSPGPIICLQELWRNVKSLQDCAATWWTIDCVSKITSGITVRKNDTLPSSLLKGIYYCLNKTDFTSELSLQFGAAAHIAEIVS